MKFFLPVLAFLIFSIHVSAQTFLNNTGGPILEVGIENNFPIDVAGLPASIDTPSFGVISVCFTILHTYDGDLDISLKAPDGTLTKLSNNNGGQSDNYMNTCVREDAVNGEISSAYPPFT